MPVVPNFSPVALIDLNEALVLAPNMLVATVAVLRARAGTTSNEGQPENIVVKVVPPVVTKLGIVFSIEQPLNMFVKVTQFDVKVIFPTFRNAGEVANIESTVVTLGILYAGDVTTVGQVKRNPPTAVALIKLNAGGFCNALQVLNILVNVVPLEVSHTLPVGVGNSFKDEQFVNIDEKVMPLAVLKLGTDCNE